MLKIILEFLAIFAFIVILCLLSACSDRKDEFPYFIDYKHHSNFA